MFKLFVLSLVLIFSGSFLGHQIQTDGGNVEVRDVRFQGDAGQTMSALLYIPESATDETPQPGILAVHGYINSRETQSGFAIELARRGFVVLALDQTGHGYSDPPAFAHSLGGPDGLRYLRSLPMVDKEKIGLEGHSMGGWTVLLAADAMPNDYRTMVLLGSSTGTFGAPKGTAEFPRNLMLVFSLFDEFSGFMWDAPIPANIVHTDKLKAVFNTTDSVVPGKIYGDKQSLSARQLEMPAVSHPGDHLSTEAIGHTTDWMQSMLGNSHPLPASNQSWYWKELGTFAALVGLLLLIIPISAYLLKLPLFSALTQSAVPGEELRSRSWYITAMATAIVPIITFFPIQTIAIVLFPANPLFGQAITNGIVLWIAVNGLISLIGFLRWRSKQATKSVLPLKSLLLAIGFGILVVGSLYLIALLVHGLFLTDFRFWVIALKLLSGSQWTQFFAYLPFFSLFFICLGLVLHVQLKLSNTSPLQSMKRNSLILSIGFAVLLVAQYLPLVLGGTLAIPSQPLLTIVAIQFLPLMIVIGAVSSWCFARSNNIYPGAIVNGLWVTWYVVAGQATQATLLF